MEGLLLSQGVQHSHSVAQAPKRGCFSVIWIALFSAVGENGQRDKHSKLTAMLADAGDEVRGMRCVPV